MVQSEQDSQFVRSACCDEAESYCQKTTVCPWLSPVRRSVGTSHSTAAGATVFSQWRQFSARSAGIRSTRSQSAAARVHDGGGGGGSSLGPVVGVSGGVRVPV